MGKLLHGLVWIRENDFLWLFQDPVSHFAVYLPEHALGWPHRRRNVLEAVPVEVTRDESGGAYYHGILVDSCNRVSNFSRGGSRKLEFRLGFFGCGWLQGLGLRRLFSPRLFGRSHTSARNYDHQENQTSRKLVLKHFGTFLSRQF